MSTEVSIQTGTLLERALSECAALLVAEQAITADLHVLCTRLWELGKSLAELKDIVGHGKWMFYVAANFELLGKEEKSRCNRAGEAIAFYSSNLKFPDTGEFAIESIRKCVFHLAPDKERPQLAGNKPIAPHAHPLTFVNHFIKWDRQAEIGLVTRPPVEDLRRDLAPVVKRIAELGGREWLESLLS